MTTFYGIGLLAWLLFVIIAFVVGAAVYLFAVYAMTRIGRKFGVGNFWEFLVPVYNIMLLCDCAGISRWTTLAIAAPGFFLFSGPLIGVLLAGGAFLSAVCFAANVYLWGSIAEKFGKNFWFWGVITPLFLWMPALVFAFGEASPRKSGVGASSNEQGARYIEI
ncbi:hypothetical protein LJC40_01325 [Synergistaceae bacterium OttesenSCG-928-D05]|nr:hypothetical protein [Synergistaceae bacterium OttesenSCG-928-D05]